MRTLNNEGNLDILLKNMKLFDIKVLGVAETAWNNSVEDAFKQNGYVIIHPARKDEIRRKGVGIVIDKELSKCMTSYTLTSERIMSVTFKTNTGLVTIIQVYAPDSSYDDDEIENFYKILQQKIDNIPKKSTIILIGDFNARVGTNDAESMPEVVGKYTLGETNERGLRLLQFCSVNKYVLTNTIYKHKPNRRFTWISQDGKTKSQTDLIITGQDNKKIIKDSRTIPISRYRIRPLASDGKCSA